MASQWEFIEHGDVEAAVVDILLNYTPELSVYPDLMISTNLVGYSFGSRFICVSQEGSIESFPTIDRPRIDIEVFAERRSVARDISSIVLASLKYNMGRYRGNGLFLSDARVEQGLTRVPDKREECERYVFALRLTTRPDGTLIPSS